MLVALIVAYAATKRKTDGPGLADDAREVVDAVKEKGEVREVSYPIIDIEGIGSEYTEKLNGVGIKTTSDLLEACCTPSDRTDLAEKTGISGKLILEWANLADLMRINGIGEEYSDLLEEAGVDTVPELAQRNPENLHEAIIEYDKEHPHVVRRVPGLDDVKSWVEQAKALDRKLEY